MSPAALAEQVARQLTARQLSLAVAEASTGGALAAALARRAGASAFFLGGVVAYSNASKLAVLGVAAETLERHGAVSAETASALAIGVRRLFASDLGLAVSGILGPSGGTPAKPVGLTYVAVDSPAGTRVEQHVFHADRARNRAASVQAALLLVLQVLQVVGA